MCFSDPYPDLKHYINEKSLMLDMTARCLPDKDCVSRDAVEALVYHQLTLPDTSSCTGACATKLRV